MIIRLNRSRSKHTFTYTVLFILTLCVLNGRPKWIFRSHLHLPWLTDVQHVQPLSCFPDKSEQGWPIAIQSPSHPSEDDNRLTVVILTARPEFKRLPLTLAALACHLDSRRIGRVLLLVPPEDVHILEPYLSESWPWLVSILSDDHLLKHIHTDSYRLQMIFKLVLAQIIQTEYYMLLDSDCVAIWPIHVEQLLWQGQTTVHPFYKALYQIEDRMDREKWWIESEEVLQIEPNTCASKEPTWPTMGVTPIILSKTIALRTLCRLQALYGDRHFLNKLANWALWRVIFDRMWTEYTLYYLTARCTNTFETYHFHRTSSFSSNFSSAMHFYGVSVWWQTDWTSYTRYQLLESINTGLKWRENEIQQNKGGIIVDTSSTTHSLFTVLQGRQYIDPNLYHQLFYPIFVKSLKKRRNTRELVRLLETMSKELIQK